MISSFMVFGNNELSWRRKRKRFFYETVNLFFFPPGVEKNFIDGTPAVLICTCALIRDDCAGHSEFIGLDAAGYFKLIGNS